MSVAHELASEISPLMVAAEEANEASIAAICTLIATAASKRRQAGIMPGDAHMDILRLQGALNHSISAQSNVLRFHGKMSDRYQVLADDDIHPWTEEEVKKSASLAAGPRPVGEVVQLRA